MAGHTVTIVYDPQISWAELVSLAHRSHVWLVDSPDNTALVRGIRPILSRHPAPLGITTFAAQPLDDLLVTVAEHHGPGSCNRLEILNGPWADDPSRTLTELGFGQISQTDQGITAARD